MHPFAKQWNHTTHYYPRLLAAAPATRRAVGRGDGTRGSASHVCDVLDIGCGAGRFAAWAASFGHRVTGLDPDLTHLDRRREDGASSVCFIVGRAENLPVDDASVDLVTLAMVLHLCEPEPALAEIRRVLRPGGRAAVLGVGADSTRADRAWGLVDLGANAWWSRRYTELPLPITQPVRTWTEEREVLAEALPGVTWRRVPLWRYLAVWTKPD